MLKEMYPLPQYAPDRCLFFLENGFASSFLAWMSMFLCDSLG